MRMLTDMRRSPNFEPQYMRQARLAGVMADRRHASGVRTPLLSIAEAAGVQVVYDSAELTDTSSATVDQEAVAVAPEKAKEIGDTVLSAAEVIPEAESEVTDEALAAFLEPQSVSS